MSTRKHSYTPYLAFVFVSIVSFYGRLPTSNRSPSITNHFGQRAKAGHDYPSAGCAGTQSKFDGRVPNGRDDDSHAKWRGVQGTGAGPVAHGLAQIRIPSTAANRKIVAAAARKLNSYFPAFAASPGLWNMRSGTTTWRKGMPQPLRESRQQPSRAAALCQCESAQDPP